MMQDIVSYGTWCRLSLNMYVMTSYPWHSIHTQTQLFKHSCIALHWKPMSELQSITCHMASHTVTCHPTR